MGNFMPKFCSNSSPGDHNSTFHWYLGNISQPLNYSPKFMRNLLKFTKACK